MNNNEPVHVEGYEIPVDLLLEDGEEVSGAALSAAEVLSDRDEFDSLVLGEEFLGNLTNRVAEPDRSHPVDFGKVATAITTEGGYDLPDIFAPPTQAERDREELLKSLQSSPLYKQAREQFIKNSTDRTLEKRASDDDEPCACKMGIRCGEGAARVEKTKSGWIMEYDATGQLMRAYDSRA